MNKKAKLYTIGEMADITGMTRTMLRYYEEKNIVVPIMRNKENRYRYYNEKQLEELLLLKELKKVGFSLEQLKVIINNRNLLYFKSELEKKMQTHNDMIMNALKEIQHYTELYYRVLDALSMQIDDEKQPIEKKDEAQLLSFFNHQEKPIVSISYYGIFNLRKVHMEKVAYLYNIIEQYGLRTDGPVNVIFHNCIETSYSEKEGEVEVFIPLSKYDKRCPFVRMLPETQYITTTLKGDYLLLENKYQQIFNNAEKLNIKYENTSIEEYVVGPTMTSCLEEYVTKIYLPIINNKIR